MATPTKIGNKTVILAADIANAAHPINLNQPTAFNGAANTGKVLGQIYLRNNGSNSYDIAIPIEKGATGKWLIIGTGSAAEDGNSIVTPS